MENELKQEEFQVEPEPVQKSKRGRKKKEIIPNENVENDEQKIKKKRGRKAAVQFFSSSIRKQLTSENIQNNDNDNNILHLEIDTLVEEKMENKDNDNDKLKINQPEGIQEENISMHASFIQKKEVIDNEQSENIRKGYYQILREFNEEWKESCNIKCWWCTNTFEGVPIGYPEEYNKFNNKFRVKGIFCSYACSLSYIKEYVNDYPYKIYLLKFMYKTLTGAKDTYIKPALTRYALKEYGGHLTIDEFRQLSNEEKTYSMINYPMYSSRDYIAEIDLYKLKKINNNILQNKTNNIVDAEMVTAAKLRISKKNNVLSNEPKSSIEAFLRK